MFQQIVDASPDIKRLVEENYIIEIRNGYLLAHDIPYVNNNKEVKRGVLVSLLNLAGYKTLRPTDHVCYFEGEHPCRKDGSALTSIFHQKYAPGSVLADGVPISFSFSSKPSEGYKDYYEKMTTYIKIIANEAAVIDPSVTVTVKHGFPRTQQAKRPFVYDDTNSSRAGIAHLTDKFINMNIAIIGLGGTGSYVLDLVAKTKVKSIHLFDGDSLQNHNAFRIPGAASIDVLNTNPSKVSYLHEVYSKMKNGIVPHGYQMTAETLEGKITITPFCFVFICIDQGSVKKGIIDVLTRHNIPFIDVGIGIEKTPDDTLLAVARTTMGDSKHTEHLADCISFADNNGDIYADPNVQIAEINAINAVLAVIRWKIWAGFYHSQSTSYHSTYHTAQNQVINS